MARLDTPWIPSMFRRRLVRWRAARYIVAQKAKLFGQNYESARQPIVDMEDPTIRKTLGQGPLNIEYGIRAW